MIKYVSQRKVSEVRHVCDVHLFYYFFLGLVFIKSSRKREILSLIPWSDMLNVGVFFHWSLIKCSSTI